MKSRLTILVAILGIAAIAAGWIYETRLRPGIDRVDLIIPDNIDYFMTNLRYRSMNIEGSLDYELNSPRLEHYRRDDVSHVEIPSLRVIRKTSRWQMDALKGEIRHQDNLLRFREQVVMQKQGENPMQLYTESIRFEPDLDLISSEASVLIRSRQTRIEAEQAVFDLAAKIYRFNQARTTYYHDDS